MRVADYIAERIADLGVKHVFMVSGGGAMHLDDALGRRDDLEYICNHHEQACAIAAEGYARLSGGLGVAVLTTGPGGTNAITGVLGQWHDSVPALYISGQVRYDTTVASTGLSLRQLGDQEADIVALVAPITKYAAMIVDPLSVRYHFEKAVHLALSGRPGPVWLDVPLSVQATQVDPDELLGFDPADLAGAIEPEWEAGAVLAPAVPGRDVVRAAPQAPGAHHGVFDRRRARTQLSVLMRRLLAAERPVLLAGSGIRTAGADDLFLRVAERLGIPVATAWNAHDLLWETHPLLAGRPGTLGDRAGNFAVQNADLVLSLGCRLNVRQIGYEFAAFARAAWLAVVDIDENELAKPTVRADLPVHADLRWFLDRLDAELGERCEEHGEGSTDRPAWIAWCQERRRRYPVVLPAYRRVESPVNPYVFVAKLGRLLEPGDIVVCANGTACVVTLQAMPLKRGQRLVVNSGTAGMGYDLPAAIGACLATGRRVVCLAGDGSLQMNLQELQTIVHHGLPVKVFVFNNDGYLSIRQTQDNLFAGHYVGAGPQSGVSLPDMVAVAGAFGIEAVRVCTHAELGETIGAVLSSKGPALCDVVMDPAQPFAPRIMAEKLADGSLVSKPLEDMYPFLPRDEFAENMLVPPYEPKKG